MADYPRVLRDGGIAERDQRAVFDPTRSAGEYASYRCRSLPTKKCSATYGRWQCDFADVVVPVGRIWARSAPANAVDDTAGRPSGATLAVPRVLVWDAVANLN